MGAETLAAAGAGLMLGVQFNPLASVAGAALAAGLGATRRTWAAVFALGGAWLLGDGSRLFVSATDALGGSGAVAGTEAHWAFLGLWALTGLALGYALPAWAGAYVGRRVTHGTGWLAAAAVAASASGALSVLG